MKTTAQDLSNNILYRAKKEKVSVSPMKLQKLLYYVCVKYVKETGVYPIFERFEPWPYGPVIPSIYFEFKSYGCSPIKTYCKDAKGNSRMVDEDVNPTLKYCLDVIWQKFKTFTGIQLSERTHQRSSGWYAAYQKNGEIITTEEMQKDGTI